MTARLAKPLKRELEIDGQLYTVTLDPETVKITPKGGRKGRELSWRDLLSGAAELRRDLSRSVESTGDEPETSDSSADSD